MTDRAHRIAVVGAGPAGFYATGHLLDAEPEIEVDLYDRLPTPWGLVRAGVAPDHPKIKAVSRVFEKIAEKPGFRMFGNVEIGRDVSHAQLMEHYDGVIGALGVFAVLAMWWAVCGLRARSSITSAACSTPSRV